MELGYCYERGIPHSEFLSWNPEDRAKVIAYHLEQAERCDMCGTAKWEWDENKRAYIAIEDYCPGCYQREAAQDGANKTMGTNLKLVPLTPQLSARLAHQARKRRKQKQGEYES